MSKMQQFFPRCLCFGTSDWCPSISRPCPKLNASLLTLPRHAGRRNEEFTFPSFHLSIIAAVAVDACLLYKVLVRFAESPTLHEDFLRSTQPPTSPGRRHRVNLGNERGGDDAQVFLRGRAADRPTRVRPFRLFLPFHSVPFIPPNSYTALGLAPLHLLEGRFRRIHTCCT